MFLCVPSTRTERLVWQLPEGNVHDPVTHKYCVTQDGEGGGGRAFLSLAALATEGLVRCPTTTLVKRNLMQSELFSIHLNFVLLVFVPSSSPTTSNVDFAAPVKP